MHPHIPQNTSVIRFPTFHIIFLVYLFFVLKHIDTGVFVFICYDTYMEHLLEFYGEECPHCIHMHKLISQLEDELHVSVKKYEIWHNEENMHISESYANGLCMGVPFFFNTKTKKWICGSTSYEELKKWAME